MPQRIHTPLKEGTVQRRVLGVYGIIGIVIGASSGCWYDGHPVSAPPVDATCKEITNRICEKIDSCLTPFEKEFGLTEDECNTKGLPVVCSLTSSVSSSSVAYASACVTFAIELPCEPLRGFLLDSEPVRTMTPTCTTFFTDVKNRVK
jgi:hypothetical protein